MGADNAWIRFYVDGREKAFGQAHDRFPAMEWAGTGDAGFGNATGDVAPGGTLVAWKGTVKGKLAIWNNAYSSNAECTCGNYYNHSQGLGVNRCPDGHVFVTPNAQSTDVSDANCCMSLR